MKKGLYRPNTFAAPIKVVNMGNVRPTYIKRVAMELVQKYPRACSADFENNKVLVSKLTDVSSIVMRNRIAGTSPDTGRTRNSKRNLYRGSPGPGTSHGQSYRGEAISQGFSAKKRPNPGCST